MDEKKCRECGKVFDEPEQVRRHLKHHGITYQQYALRWFYNDQVPRCKCGCGKETSWNIASKRYAEFVHGHHAWGRKKSDDEKRRIGEKNAVNMKQYMKEHPAVALKRNEQMIAAHTPEIEARRIEATRKTYASMSMEDKQKFSDHAKELWQHDGGVLMQEAHQKASNTFKERSANGEYDFTERNEKLSQAITQKYLNGGFEWSKGEYTSTKSGQTYYFRSSWELQYMQLLDNDLTVIAWEYEFMSLRYMINGEGWRRYVPDFHVAYADGHHEIVEIKPENLRETLVNEAKRISAQRYCEERCWVYREWSPILL